MSISSQISCTYIIKIRREGGAPGDYLLVKMINLSFSFSGFCGDVFASRCYNFINDIQLDLSSSQVDRVFQ